MRFAYARHDADGRWFRSCGNENWEFAENGLTARRIASISDLPVAASGRLFRWDCDAAGRRPENHPGLSDWGFDRLTGISVNRTTMKSSGAAPAPARAIITEWIDALTAALKTASMKPAVARSRATEAVVAIEDALIVAQATGDQKVFRDWLSAVRRSLLADLPP